MTGTVADTVIALGRIGGGGAGHGTSSDGHTNWVWIAIVAAIIVITSAWQFYRRSHHK